MIEDVDLLARLAGIPKRLLMGGAVISADAHEAMHTRRKHKRQGQLRKGNTAWGQFMAARRVLLISASKRKKIATNAAKARWRGVS
jgi:hypothetical protein